MTRPAILVTGAADRIGRRIAQRFAASGWHVVIHHRHHPDEAAALAARNHGWLLYTSDDADQTASV